MKTKKILKFSKETVLILDNTSKKNINGGNAERASNTSPKCELQTLYCESQWPKICFN